MEYVEKIVKLPKETQELSEAIVETLKAVKEAGKDGYQVADIGAVLPVVIAKFPPAVEGMDKIVSEELKNDPEAFAKAASLLGAEILSVFIKKPEIQA